MKKPKIKIQMDILSSGPLYLFWNRGEKQDSINVWIKKEEEKRKGKELKKKNREYGENERGKMENNCDYEKGVFVERIKDFALDLYELKCR